MSCAVGLSVDDSSTIRSAQLAAAVQFASESMKAASSAVNCSNTLLVFHICILHPHSCTYTNYTIWAHYMQQTRPEILIVFIANQCLD